MYARGQLLAHWTPRVVRQIGYRRVSSVAHQTRGHTTKGLDGHVQDIVSTAQRAHSAPFHRRTHTCKTLSAASVNSRVVIAGWILPERKVNKRLSFFNLRDSHGVVQLVAFASDNAEVLSKMREAPTESTVLLQGVVRMRAEAHRRPYPGGDIEVVVDSFTLLNPADRNLPFIPSDSHNLANEHLRLRHRYLDLRRDALSANIRKRSDVSRIMRAVFHEKGFTEVETPMLLKSTPEGAREFLVPTRLMMSSEHSESDDQSSSPQPLFYALPQSPQQPKQLLIASGAVDNYYQLARCFRDEDGRKDRQPEFTQVDLEMAWVSWGESGDEVQTAVGVNELDLNKFAVPSAERWRIGGCEVRQVVESLVRRVWDEVESVQLPDQFPVMTYATAMSRYGSDKPDLRFGLEIENITPYLPAAIRDVLSSRDEIVEALIVRNAEPSHTAFLRAATQLQDTSDGAVERIVLSGGGTDENIVRSRTVGALTSLGELHILGTTFVESLNLLDGGILWITRRPRRPEGGSTALGRLRLQLSSSAQNLGDVALTPDPQFLWVTEFPLFTHADPDKDFLAHGRWSSSHHPFTAPMWQDIDKMYNGEISEVRGQHYDLVLNGVEIGGGSVRVHDAAMQEHIFSEILQLNGQEKSSFDHLLHALRCGAPPHGGFAFGFDRLMAILCKTESIRDVIAFPKTGAGTDLLFKSPASVSHEVLGQYGIKLP